jgi:hypothetical protein
MTGIHDSLIVIDGLVISKWSREVFADMRKGGLTAANCTCSIWEGFAETMRNIAQWKRWFTDNADLITPVHTTADIRRAKAEGKTGIILGFQNTSAFEDQVGYIALFKDLGVGVVQITYNIQNLAGAGCQHPQNAHDTGFYPITRVLADLWARIAEKDPDQARALALGWAKTSFLLSNRLYVYALASREVFSAHEAARVVRSLDDRFFWAGGARVEVMGLLTSCWAEFDDDDRSAVEMRICNGVPREMFPADRFDDEGWESFNDGEMLKRLKRIHDAGGVLSADSVAKLDLISQRHPQWVASASDRDDFQIWHGEVVSGPSGDPELLSGIADDRLVQEAMRLQAQQYFAQGDLWSVFCQADPDRALRGLRARAETGDWASRAWEGLLWAAHQKGEVRFQQELADALLQAPNVVVKPFLGRRRGVAAAAAGCTVER